MYGIWQHRRTSEPCVLEVGVARAFCGEASVECTHSTHDPCLGSMVCVPAVAGLDRALWPFKAHFVMHSNGIAPEGPDTLLLGA